MGGRLVSHIRSAAIDLALASTLFFLLLLSLDGVDLPLTSQTTFDSELELHSGTKVGQSFIAAAPGLYRVDLLLPQRGANSAPLEFHLQQRDQGSDDLATIETDASLLEDLTNPIRRPNVYKAFTFRPIQGSRGEEFFFHVEAPLSTAQHPVLVRYQSENAYDEGAMYVDGAAGSGDLAFKLYYRGRPFETADLLLARLTQDKPFPLSHKASYGATLLAYLLLFVRLARVVSKWLFNWCNR
jgi:hypothetical protein